ncbi:Adhesion G-protein coupled receptor G4 [Holothuria leucospilota]|uniref:Adhesion G-protein coupled receptor G4 n=1 Tax=Holothuria leucospilota TaxID=206669 RepID=A0A9Q1H8E7_HOLLE|nr:Adhesion G-protein coupled receptor G4 [Holothuria leucospilota]
MVIAAQNNIIPNLLSLYSCFIDSSTNIFRYCLLLVLAIFLGYICFVFLLISWKLTCGRKTFKKSGLKRQEIYRRIQNVIAISVLLGVTWISGFLAIGKVRMIFNIIFCVCNSLQGFFIFLLFCVRQKDIRLAWKNSITWRPLSRMTTRKASTRRLLSTRKATSVKKSNKIKAEEFPEMSKTDGSSGSNLKSISYKVKEKTSEFTVSFATEASSKAGNDYAPYQGTNASLMKDKTTSNVESSTPEENSFTKSASTFKSLESPLIILSPYEKDANIKSGQTDSLHTTVPLTHRNNTNDADGMPTGKNLENDETEAYAGSSFTISTSRFKSLENPLIDQSSYRGNANNEENDTKLYSSIVRDKQSQTAILITQDNDWPSDDGCMAVGNVTNDGYSNPMEAKIVQCEVLPSQDRAFRATVRNDCNTLVKNAIIHGDGVPLLAAIDTQDGEK